MKILRQFLWLLVYIFAAIGFFLMGGFLAVKWGLTNAPGIVDTTKNFRPIATVTQDKAPAWATGEEWDILQTAITKDASLINHVGAETGIKPRTIVAMLVVEQLRLYHDQRETFKSFFAPLRVLGSQTQFSWGVLGMKQDTAKQVENNLKDKTSPFYLGQTSEHLLDFPAGTTDIDGERFKRITNEDDHYYSYLYAALYLKQIQQQWQKAGFPIEQPEILATLFNIGFANSKPNAHPEAGGALIEFNGQSYSFGRLAYEFYYSPELLDLFPR